MTDTVIEVSVPSPVQAIEVAVQGVQGPKGDTGVQNLFIQSAQPSYSGPYFWIQTGLSGGGFQIWFHDGV